MKIPMNRISVFLIASLFISTGCVSNPFKKNQPEQISLEPPPGIAAPAHTLSQFQGTASAPSMPSYASLNGPELEVALTRSQQKSMVMQDEIAVLQEQLASTSNQLAQERMQNQPAQTLAAKPDVTSPLVMESAMGQLSLPGFEVRFDGSVVRIEIPADRVFEKTTAKILPSGVSILTQAADELARVYPRHFIGIEGHFDTEPLADTSWKSTHEFTAARSTAVFNFFISRTPLLKSQLFVVAHGSNHPVVSNATAAGRARNRRVELVIYPEQSDDQSFAEDGKSIKNVASSSAWQPVSP